MSTRVRHGWVRWVPAGLIVFLAVGASALAADPPELLALKKATADGKYTNLLAVIHMPSDKETYGEYKDYGAYNGTDWGRYKGLPKGNWVYVYPRWYIWEKEKKARRTRPNPGLHLTAAACSIFGVQAPRAAAAGEQVVQPSPLGPR
jgi:hypothetical protein